MEIVKKEKNSIADFFGDSFTDEEKLIGNMILTYKAQHGLTSRLKHSINYISIDYIEDNKAREKLMDLKSSYNSNFEKIIGSQKEILKGLANKLGISEKRYNELKDYVYDRECML